MSNLKQSVYKIVKKDETVLNGYDAANPGLEGAVFQCNFDAKDFTQENFLGVDGGTTIPNQGFVRYTFTQNDGTEVTKGFIAQTAYELIKSKNISTENGESAFADLQLFQDEDGGLYKNGSKYFLRNYTLYGSVNLASSTDFDPVNDLIVAENLIKLTTEGFTVSDAIGQLYDSNLTSSTVAKVAFANHDGLRIFEGTPSYFGIITANAVIPNAAWFYYNGQDLLNNGVADQLTAEQADNIGAGFFYNNTGADVDFSDISAIGALFADQSTIDTAASEGSPIISYILAGNTGGLQVGFTGSQSIDAAIGIEEYSNLLLSSEYSNITNASASNFWNPGTSFDSPLTDEQNPTTSSDESSLLLVDADILTDSTYWDKISENFVEDKDISVGATGIDGANLLGSYASNVTPRVETDTYQTLEVESVVNGTATDNLTFDTFIKHGIPQGSTVEVVLAGFTGVDSEDINGTKSVKAVDRKTLEVLNSTTKVVASPTEGSYPVLSKLDFTNIVWEQVSLESTNQALIYRG